MRRRLLRPFWIALALLFLLEAWLWEKLELVVAAFVDLVAWRALKLRLRALIERVPPAAALLIFLIPMIVLLPFKLFGLWLLARGHWIAALLTLALAKLTGVGVAAFVFDATRPKLLQLDWFRWVYTRVLMLRGWALQQVEPVRARLLQLTWLLKPQRAGRFMRRLWRLRRRAYRARPA